MASLPPQGSLPLVLRPVWGEPQQAATSADCPSGERGVPATEHPGSQATRREQRAAWLMGMLKSRQKSPSLKKAKRRRQYSLNLNPAIKRLEDTLKIVGHDDLGEFGHPGCHGYQAERP